MRSQSSTLKDGHKYSGDSCYCACTVQASDTAAMDPERARKLARASYMVSTIGVVISGIILVVVLLLIQSGDICTGYRVHGECYRNRSYDDSAFDCSLKGGILDGAYCYYN